MGKFPAQFNYKQDVIVSKVATRESRLMYKRTTILSIRW